jgi:hypothetical protein
MNVAAGGGWGMRIRREKQTYGSREKDVLFAGQSRSDGIY